MESLLFNEIASLLHGAESLDLARNAARKGLLLAADLDPARDYMVAAMIVTAARVGVDVDREYRRLLAQREAILSAREAFSGRESVAELALLRGDLEFAEAIERRELAHYEGMNQNVAYGTGRLAHVVERAGRMEEAAGLRVRIVQLQEESFGPDAPETSSARIDAGAVLQGAGAHARALPYYLRALEGFAKNPGAESLDYAGVADEVGYLKAMTGDTAGSLEHFARALSIRARLQGPAHEDALKSRFFSYALKYADEASLKVAATRLRKEIESQTDPAAAAWYPPLWEAEQVPTNDPEFGAVRKRIQQDLVRIRGLKISADLSAPIIAAGESALSIPSAEIHVQRIRQENGQWAAEVAAPFEPYKRILRVGDRLKDGVVTSVAKDHLLVLAKIPASALDPSETENLLLRFSPPQALPPITLGLDTTRIMRPLLKDGTPDYGAWLNEKYGEAVIAENNAAGPMRAAADSFVDAGHTFWTGTPFEGTERTKMLGPWTERDCPSCAARLKLNEAPLAAFAAATLRPRYFEPTHAGGRFAHLFLPSLLGFRQAANAFAPRGMLRITTGDLEGAVNDALTSQRLASLLARGPGLMDRLIANSVQGVGVPLLPAIASAPALSEPLARGFLSTLVDLPSPRPLAEVFDLYERMTVLDAVLTRREWSAKRGAGGMAVENHWVDSDAGLIVKLRYALPVQSFDWNFALMETNREVDLAVAYLNAPPGPQRQKAAAMIEAERKRLADALASLNKDLVDMALQSLAESGAPEPTDRAAADSLLILPAQTIASTPEGRRRLTALVPRFGFEFLTRNASASNETQSQYRVGVLTVALAVHRLKMGGFPATLDELGADLLPARFGPSTPLPGYTMRYTQTAGTAGAPGTFAIIAKPEEYKVSGTRAFCVDSTGAMRQTLDGTEPKLVDGVCDPGMDRSN